jgi:hypothetical protein
MGKKRRHAINYLAIVAALCMGSYFPRLFDVVNITTFVLFGTASRRVKARIGFQEELTLWSVFGAATTSLFWTSQGWLQWMRFFSTMGHLIMMVDHRNKVQNCMALP